MYEHQLLHIGQNMSLMCHYTVVVMETIKLFIIRFFNECQTFDHTVSIAGVLFSIIYRTQFV